ncbi:hypothetical protein ECANGB1_2337 [Enterospora canceri]|uniref:Uncharacterized protein n=1 Tax=Enterospora canceri TaxID=1081671 RepID=A0A1Y1S8K3_9MICR|nr:hypothetical protein ECANGB1_2337 [Enterospora canceri]
MGGLGSDALHSILNHMPGTGNSGIGSNGIGGIGNSGNMGGMSGMSADGGLGSNQWMGSKSTDIYSLPDPQKLVAAVEQATANFLNIKNNLRRVLERTKMYLSRSAVLLTELTSDIKVKYAELKETTKKHNRESAPHIKAVLAKKMIDLRSELRELIGMFEKIRKWQMTVTCSIATTL